MSLYDLLFGILPNNNSFGAFLPLYKEDLYACRPIYSVHKSGIPKRYLPSFLSNDGQHLLSASNNLSREIIEWDFRTGQKLNKIHLKHYIANVYDIEELNVKWPYALVKINLHDGNGLDLCGIRDYKIVVCNMINGKLIRVLKFKDVIKASNPLSIELQENILCIRGGELVDCKCLKKKCKEEFFTTRKEKYIESQMQLVIYDFDELMRGNDEKSRVLKNFNDPISADLWAEGRELEHFAIYLECTKEYQSERGSAIVGNNIYTIENKQLVKRSFWP